MSMPAPPQPAPGGPEPALRRPDGTPIRVLVVDDEPSLAELLATVLRYEGWEIRTAADGLGAVRAAREFRPDAVVLDVMLPDLSGLQVLGRLRAELPHVCVLFLTARDAFADRVAGITAGGDDYVTKPFSLEEVLVRPLAEPVTGGPGGWLCVVYQALHDSRMPRESHGSVCTTSELLLRARNGTSLTWSFRARPGLAPGSAAARARGSR